MSLTLQPHLLTGGALPTPAALTLAARALEYGLPVVEAGPTAAGIEFHQILVQGPAQVLLFGLQRPEVCVPQEFVDGLHLPIQEELRDSHLALPTFSELKDWLQGFWKACCRGRS